MDLILVDKPKAAVLPPKTAAKNCRQTGKCQFYGIMFYVMLFVQNSLHKA